MLHQPDVSLQSLKIFLLLLGLGACGLSYHWGNGNAQPTLEITSQRCQAALKRKTTRRCQAQNGLNQIAGKYSVINKKLSAINLNES